MDKYYYLASQLPMLRFEEKTGVTRDWLLSEAEKWLDSSSFSALSRFGLDDFYPAKKDRIVIKKYKKFEESLRTELMLLRQAKKSGQEFKPNFIPYRLIKDLNPLQVEKNLLRFRWDYIEEEEREHYSDFTFIVFYCLKVQILEKLFSFDKEKGNNKFQELCEVNYD
ncbi:MAG: DUF2764 family protein [Candidatus Omnitrophica bacterium]|nr:DUF2764 family protein [Candidatus Omnitrophota bacterium]